MTNERADRGFPCRCCAAHTLSEEPPGTYEICEVCGWEDELVGEDDSGGANGTSLRAFRRQFRERMTNSER
jgi:hypothetical protein